MDDRHTLTSPSVVAEKPMARENPKLVGGFRVGPTGLEPVASCVSSSVGHVRPRSGLHRGVQKKRLLPGVSPATLTDFGVYLGRSQISFLLPELLPAVPIFDRGRDSRRVWVPVMSVNHRRVLVAQQVSKLLR